MHISVLTLALLFMATLAGLTVRGIHTRDPTPIGMLAVVVVVLFTTGILGALLHPPRQ